MISSHMAFHIIAMNIAAPAASLMWHRFRTREFEPRFVLLSSAVVLQLSVLWFWHLPMPLAVAGDNPFAMAMMHTSLLVAAVFFWHEIVVAADKAAWHALLGLLITGKLACLLGVLLTFAPRAIYFPDHSAGLAAMADQQLAGLMMLIACPLTYIGAAIVIVVRWLDAVERVNATETAWRAQPDEA